MRDPELSKSKAESGMVAAGGRGRGTGLLLKGSPKIRSCGVDAVQRATQRSALVNTASCTENRDKGRAHRQRSPRPR